MPASTREIVSFHPSCWLFWCTAVTGKPGLTKNNNKNLVTLERFSLLRFFFVQTRNTDTLDTIDILSFQSPVDWHGSHFWSLMIRKLISFICYLLCALLNSGSFQRFGIDGQPPLFLPPHLASLSSQFTPPLFSVKGELLLEQKRFSHKFKILSINLHIIEYWISEARNLIANEFLMEIDWSTFLSLSNILHSSSRLDIIAIEPRSRRSTHDAFIDNIVVIVDIDRRTLIVSERAASKSARTLGCATSQSPCSRRVWPLFSTDESPSCLDIESS